MASVLSPSSPAMRLPLFFKGRGCPFSISKAASLLQLNDFPFFFFLLGPAPEIFYFIAYDLCVFSANDLYFISSTPVFP